MKEEVKKKAWQGLTFMLEVPTTSSELNYDDVFAVVDALRLQFHERREKEYTELLSGLEEIREKARRITTGDLPHNQAWIVGVANRLISEIKEQVELDKDCGEVLKIKQNENISKPNKRIY